MKKMSEKTMSVIQKKSKNLTNSLLKESMEMKKQSMKNSKALIELDRKTQKANKKAKKNPGLEKQEINQVQEIKMHPSLAVLFWLSLAYFTIKTLLGI